VTVKEVDTAPKAGVHRGLIRNETQALALDTVGVVAQQTLETRHDATRGNPAFRQAVRHAEF
jgi:hypothetical protein